MKCCRMYVAVELWCLIKKLWQKAVQQMRQSEWKKLFHINILNKYYIIISPHIF